jgi:hypothetical protein
MGPLASEFHTDIVSPNNNNGLSPSFKQNMINNVLPETCILRRTIL